MNRKFLYAFTALVALSAINSTSAETIRQTVDQALQAHPSIEAAMASKDVASEEGKEVRSGLFPEVSLGASAGRIFGDNSTSRGLVVNRGEAYSWLGEGNASMRQPIFDGMETFHRMDAASARVDSADYNVLDVKENLALRAVQAHISVMQAQATLNKVKSYYASIEDYLERIQLMVDEGVADEAEKAQALNISLMLKSALTDYEGQLEAAYANYKEVTGNLPKSELIKPVSIESLLPVDVEAAITKAKQEHPLILSGIKDLEAAGYDIEAERSGYYPNLDGELSYLKRDQKEEIGGELTDARALLKMSWDFETGGAQKARTRKSKAQYSEKLAQNREQVRIIEGDIRRAFAEYETARKQMDLVKKREVATQDLFDAHEVQFEGARVRLLQVMQAENQLFNAQLESITAEYRYLLSQYSALASMGELMKSVPSIDISSLEKSTPLSSQAEKIDESVIITSDDLEDQISSTTK